MTSNTPLLLLPESRRGHGIYSLTIELAAPLEEPLLRPLLQATRSFIAAASRGAFPAEQISPLDSSARLLEEVVQDLQVLIWVLDVRNLDLYGLELVRNMAMRLEVQGIAVSGLRLDGPAQLPAERRKSDPEDENEFDAYPAVSKHLGFASKGEEGDVGKMRRCLVELSVPVETAHIARLSQWVAPWYELLEGGAFARPVGLPSETESFRGDVTLFDEQSIEITVNRFQASETAWHPLLNMLGTCWGDRPVIANVLVD
jgi:hypothetical protein